MTLHIKNIWLAINKVLTIINAVLLGLVTGNIGLYNPQKEKYVKVPVAANILLLLVLSLVLSVFVFKYS